MAMSVNCKIKWICLSILMLFLITSCDLSLNKSSFVEDTGSPKKANMLKDRASQFWALMVKQDLKEAYKYYDPFFRAKMNVETFAEKHSVIRYQEAEVTNVKVEGNIGTVTVKVTYFVPKVKVRRQEFEVPPTTKSFDERWLFIYDNWYKEYYSGIAEASIAYY